MGFGVHKVVGCQCRVGEMNALTPEVVHDIQLPDLREEAAHCLLVLLAVLYGPSPGEMERNTRAGTALPALSSYVPVLRAAKASSVPPPQEQGCRNGSEGQHHPAICRTPVA